MTDDDRSPVTDAELRAELEALLRQAADSGVDVRGAWECHGRGATDWDVVVTELQLDSGSD